MDIKGGVNEKLNKNAGNLSTGQKKRLALTRAINKKPDLLLMDDVTNPLDMITEKQVLDNVLQSDMSVVIASQKPSAVMRSDRIIVIDNGKLLDVAAGGIARVSSSMAQIRTTRKAGGLLWPYKGLLPAAPKDAGFHVVQAQCPCRPG